MSQQINRILCCIGMRGNCDSVIEQGVNLALATGAEMHILHVIKSLSDDAIDTLRAHIRDRNLLNSLTKQRTEQGHTTLAAELEAFWGRFPQLKEAMKDRDISLTVLEGFPASVICQFASAKKCDMILVAANKKPHLASYAGKVTKGVIKRSKVPVVVVPVVR